MKKGLLAGIIGAALIIAAVVVFIVTYRAGEPETLRSIKVIELDGTCNIIRNGETIAAQKDMDLYTDDVVEVSEGSFAEIRLDDDKFLYLDENTIIDISATGDAETSDTMIFVEQGGMMTEVINKLSAESAFTIVTANTSMHITGTIVMVQTGEKKLIAGEKAENGLIDLHDKKVTASNAILEGSAVVRAYSLDATGNQVLVGETTLSAGEGNSYTGSPVLNDGHIKALTGANQSLTISTPHDRMIYAPTGNAPATSNTEAEAGNGDGVEEGGSTGETSVFSTPEFDGEFLLRAQGVLGASTPHPNANEELSKRAREKRQMGLAWMDNIKAINGHNKIVLSSVDSNSTKVTADIKADSGELGVIYDGQHSDSADGKAGALTVKLDNVKKDDLQIENSRSKAEEERVKVAEFSPVSETVEDFPVFTEDPKMKETEMNRTDSPIDPVFAEETDLWDLADQEQAEVKSVTMTYKGLNKTITKGGNSILLQIIFCERTAEGELERVSGYELPNSLDKGSVLPGIEIPGVDPDIIIDVTDADGGYAGYYFAGWFKSQVGADAGDLKDQIDTVPNDVNELTVYAGIVEEPVYDVSENDQMFAISGND